MRSKERPEFTGIISALAAAFNREATEPLYHAYWLGLQDISLEAVKRAAAVVIRDEKFMPAPAELRELAGVMRPQDRVVKAWEVVEEAMRRIGPGRTVLFDDPVTNATIANIWHTWKGLDDAWEKDDEKWLRKEFERVYVSLFRLNVGLYRDEPNYRKAISPLLGQIDLNPHNSAYMRGLAEARGTKRPGVVRIACGLPALSQLTQEPKRPSKQLAAPVELIENVGVMPEE